MTGFNKVILAGNLTRDVELRYTPSGTPIAGFGLAINRKWKDQNGEMKEDCTFVDVTAWGKQAEILGQYSKKGKPLLVEGRLQMDQWTDKQSGEKKSKLKVVLETFVFLSDGGAREGGSEYDQERKPRQKQSGKVKPEEQPPAPEDEDSIPF